MREFSFTGNKIKINQKRNHKIQFILNVTAAMYWKYGANG